MQIHYDFLKNKIRSSLLIDELKNSGFGKICIFGAGGLGSGLGYEALTQKFNLSIDEFRKLTFLSGDERFEIIRGLPLIGLG